MRKISIAFLAIACCGCFSEAKKDAASKPAATEATALPYTATYSSKFEMGEAKQVEIVLKLWKGFDDGDLNAGKKFFADTIRIHSRDGSIMSGPLDSVHAQVQAFRNTLSSVKSTVHAIVPIKSTDKGDNWINIWGEEVSVDKQGKKDSVALQESWRFNKDGKVDVMYQYSRPLPAAPARK